MKKSLEKLDNDLFKSLNVNEMKNVVGGTAPYNTYATSGAGGATPKATEPSDTNDLSTGATADWKNL